MWRALYAIGFSGEVELTFGIDSVVNSDIPANEFTDVYDLIEAAVEYDFGDGLKAFSALTVESVIAPTDDRFLEDLGLYFGELGLSYTFGSTTVFGGKITPKFATALDRFTFNAAHTSPNSTGLSTDASTSLGFDYSINDATEIDFGVARIREAGVYSTNLGMELIHLFTFGG